MGRGREQGWVIRSQLQRPVDPPGRFGSLVVLRQQGGLGAERFGPIRRRGEQGLLALVQRQHLVQPARGQEQLAGGLQGRAVPGVELEGVLVTDGGAARVAEEVTVDVAHGVVQSGGLGARAQLGGLPGQILQRCPSGLDL